MNNNKEIRHIKIDDKQLHLRAEQSDDGIKKLIGYGSVFNVQSRLLFEMGEIFYEIIKEGAFDEILASDSLDVILTFNHNTYYDMPLARLNPSKGIETLKLSVDEKGLRFETEIPNTTNGNDLWETVRRGDLYECSFVFTVEDGQEWSTDDKGNNIRTITNVAGLYDVSVVTNGAYETTDVAVAERSFKEFEKEKVLFQSHQYLYKNDSLKRELELLKLK